MPKRGTGSRTTATGAKDASAARPFFALLRDVQGKVEARLSRVLDERVERAETIGSEVFEMVAALRDLCGRGGKRLRPALVCVGARAVDAKSSLDVAIEAGVSLELLQAYFLIHDDWMDGDVERRGGPTAHVHLARRFRSPAKGASAAILTGDYAVALATRVLGDLALSGRKQAAILRCFADMQLDAVAGQGLDVIGRTGDVELTYRLKTASYTVRGPLVLGALLAGGSPKVLRSLEAYALPAGVAFQIRDDLIGVFGDPALTGKPRGGDLRAGKHTLLVEAALKRGTAAERQRLRRVLGQRRATDRQIEWAIAHLDACGARAEVEARMETLAAEARQAVEASPCTPVGRQLLLGALTALISREA